VEINWRELINPGAGIVPTREKDLSFESSFHSRMSPSQDPKWKNGIHGHMKTTIPKPSDIPDARRSEYRKLAMAVIHLGVSITPSVSECT
jgi:hypothetical protein